MRRKLLLCIVLVVIVPCHYGQTSKNKTVSKEAKEAEDAKETLALRRINLLSDLKALGDEVAKIDPPFARAVAKLEIADAAWTLDQEYAKKLLREAYDLTLQEKEEERQSIRQRPLDAFPEWPTAKETARTSIRSKIMAIAGRDRAFVTELREYVKQQLGRAGESEMYASLVKQAMQDGKVKEASAYAVGYIEVDPNSAGLGPMLIELGKTDREVADRLVLQYIERMRRLEPSFVLLSHVHFHLVNAVLANPYNMESRNGTLGGLEAIKAVLQYVIASAFQLERREPGTSRGLGSNIMPLWSYFQQYAPELIAPLAELQQIWGAQGWKGTIPTMTNAEKNKAYSEDVIKTAFETRQPQDLRQAIAWAVRANDFTAARKLLDLLPKGSLHQTLAEELDCGEAGALARKGETAEAERLARKVSTPGLIYWLYPDIMKACFEKKDPYCARSLMAEATKRLKNAQNKNDVLRTLVKLATAIAPMDEVMALEVLDEAVSEANHVATDVQYGSVGFSRDVFVTLVAKHEARVRQMAGDLKDRFQRIVTLAAVYQAKAKELAKEAEAAPAMAK